MTDATTAPRPTRPRLHVWAEGPEPIYLGVVTVTNRDQLLAETQAKGLGINSQASPFHVSALWAWAAAVRQGLTDAKFKAFCDNYAWESVKDDDDQEAAAEDPTFGGPEPSTA